MTKDSLYRLLKIDALMNQVYEQLSIVANEEQDGRYRGMTTQAYGLKQDIEDKMREDLLDGPQQIASAPNLPNQNTTNVNNNPTSNGNSVSSTPSNSVTQQNNGVQQNQQNFTNNGNQQSSPNNAIPNPTGQISPTVGQFFDDLLSGKAGNNQDLNDILAKMKQTSQTNNGNSIPF